MALLLIEQVTSQELVRTNRNGGLPVQPVKPKELLSVSSKKKVLQ